MKKTDNRAIKFLVIISFVFSIFFLIPSFIDKTYAHADDEINPTEVGPCYLYGIHKMYSKGSATVKYKDTGKNALRLGTMYRCACNSTIVTQGRPPGAPIGIYITNPTPVIGIAGHVSYVTPRSNVKNTSKYSLPGYRFY